MSKSPIIMATLISGISLIMGGCKPRPIPDSHAAAATSTAPTSMTPAFSTPIAISSPTIAAPTHAMITVAAVKGNVFIRRGPDLAFDPVSVLMDGQRARALARDVLAKWVQIPIPGQGQRTGWVSVQTRFVALTGDILQLPELTPTDWPVLASLRNCTLHAMEADPGGIPIPAVTAFPDNDVPINPGIYTIHDTAVDDSPEVMKAEVREGLHIDIQTDGDGNHKKCPVP